MAVIARPPVVAILGHVDHGKTTLLDTIRKTSVAAGEAGGITQHIGAYQAEHNGKKITFLDTPGHAAFKQMRSRGAQATDIVVLVVSAVEGVKPQTVESIGHVLSAGVPYIVALTKMDLPDANPEMVKAQLTEHQVFVENYGGDTPVIPVSAKTGAGLGELLDMILLLADLHELKADPEGVLHGVIIESVRDKRRGVLGTVLIKNGTLKKGQQVWADSVSAKVRSLTDDRGKSLDSAGPSQPVEVVGWDDVPAVGSVLSVESAGSVAKQNGQASSGGPELAGGPTLNMIIKADTLGTLEAILSNLSSEVSVIASGVGEVTDADVQLAEATKSRILGFHVRMSGGVQKSAELAGVRVKLYSVIYELFEDVQKLVLKLIEPTIDEVELGTAEVLAVFSIRGETIAGCKVIKGEMTKGQKYHIKRKEQIIADPARMKSLKRGKEDIDVAKAGTECGIVFRDFSSVQVGDLVISYKMADL